MNEIEIDSRDFYVDNQTLAEVIENVTRCLEQNTARIVKDKKSVQREERLIDEQESKLDSLDRLEDIEIFEPEFSEPTVISFGQVKEKLQFLRSKSFFDTPRTVSETVEQLREYGWAASLLDVSKVLVKMSFNKEILRNSRDRRNFYFDKEALLTN